MRILTLLLACGLPGLLMAQQPKDAARLNGAAEDSIDQTLSARTELMNRLHVRGMLPESWRTTLVDGREATLDTLGLDLALTYDALAMGAINTADEWGSSAGDLSLTARWNLLKYLSGRPLILATRVRNRSAYGDLAPSQLRTETNAAWGFVSGFTAAGLQIPEFYFEEELFTQRLLIRYGQMDSDGLLDVHSMRSAKQSFLNQAFSSSPGVGFPGSGLGLVGRWKGSEKWDLTASVNNLEALNEDEQVKWSFDNGAVFAAVQLGLNYDGWKGKPGRFQTLLWNGSALPEQQLDASRGVSIVVEQEIDERVTGLLRLAWSDGNLAQVDRFAAAGLNVKCGDLDRFGIGLGIGESTRESSGWQGVFEAFYRHQYGPHLQISPDVQFAVGEHLAAGAGWLVVAGLRVGVTF